MHGVPHLAHNGLHVTSSTHPPTALTAMTSLLKLTMRSSNKTWTRYVRVIGRRGTCVRWRTLS